MIDTGNVSDEPKPCEETNQTIVYRSAVPRCIDEMVRKFVLVLFVTSSSIR